MLLGASSCSEYVHDIATDMLVDLSLNMKQRAQNKRMSWFCNYMVRKVKKKKGKSKFLNLTICSKSFSYSLKESTYCDFCKRITALSVASGTLLLLAMFFF